jgi:hypothetical protein
LKAGSQINITGGTIILDSADDAIHSNGKIAISSGNLSLISGDDGIHADEEIYISNGDIKISKSYEGIESSVILINGGRIHVTSSDDGINIRGGLDGSSINGRPGQNPFAGSGSYHLDINAGYIVVDSMGDGIDVNGSINMTGGTVIISGPTANNNGAIDYDGTFVATGGFITAAGSAGMAQGPSTTSKVYSIKVTFSTPLPAGTIVHIETKDGKEVLTFVLKRVFQSVVLSSPELKNGSSYVIYTGGSSTGTVQDGIYTGGTYKPGTQFASFTISSTVTNVGLNIGGGGRP